MLFPEEWTDTVDRVVGLWGSSAKWRKPQATYGMVVDLEKEHLDRAIDWFFYNGRPTVPSPAELVLKAREVRGTVVVPSEMCRHPRYAIIDDEEDDAGRVMRHVICMTCHHERWVKPHVVLTEGEIDNGKPNIQPVPAPRSGGQGAVPGPLSVELEHHLKRASGEGTDPGDLPGDRVRTAEGHAAGADPAAGAKEGTGREPGLPDPF